MCGRGMNPFKDHNIVYIEQPYQTFATPQNSDINYDYFEQHKNKLVVINFSSEHWGNFPNHVCAQLSKTDINFLLLTYDHTAHQQHPRMFYFPHWYYESKNIIKKISINPGKNYFLGCLNGAPRPHRIANFLKLRKKPYWNNTSITFHNGQPPLRFGELPLTDDEANEWEEIRYSFPKKPTASYEFGFELDIPQLSDCYLHLTTETSIVPGVFITEKTWKPVAAGVPFVMYGNPGTMDFLKSIGVDTYDDVIDHKYYDNEKDARSRLDKLHKIVDDLVVQGVDKAYTQLSNRIVDNQTKFFNGGFDTGHQQTIINAINQYK